MSGLSGLSGQGHDRSRTVPPTGPDGTPEPLRPTDGADFSPAAGADTGSAMHPEPAALDLEDLLDEIRSRASGESRSQERLSQLLMAVLAISSHLELSAVLTRIVESACTLVGARYGALGVLDAAHSGLSDFLTVGIDDDIRAEIGELPQGRGLLGTVIRDAETLRLDRIRDHPDSVGLPPGHPEMTTFIGTPVRVRDTVFGNLYLTEKVVGGTFSADDEAVLEGLAAAAGIAIENAQLYRRSVARERWARAGTELTQTLLEGGHERSALSRMARRARSLSGASVGLVATRGDDGVRAVHAVDTDHARPDLRPADLTGMPLDADDWTTLLRGRSPVMLLSRDEPGDLTAALRRQVGLDVTGVSVVVPMAVGSVEVGLLVMLWADDGVALARDAMEPLAGFGEQMALAIEAAQAGRQRTRARLLEERDRIARDMHDHVIQRLYAAGLSLQATTRLVDDPRGIERLDGVVDQLDLAVKDLRSTIYGLQRQLPVGGLGPEIEQIVGRAADSCGFVPDLTIEGTLADVPTELEHDVVAVVTEALSNMVRHSRATCAEVHIATHDDLIVTVVDDGIGIGADDPHSGLVNLEERALAYGGTFSVSARHPRGTLLRWRVPLYANG